MPPGPTPQLLVALRSREARLALIADAAAAEAALLLAVPLAPRLIWAPGGGRDRPLPHGARRSRLPAASWSAAFLYRNTYHADRLAALLAALPGAPPLPLLLVTDVELQPPPDWRYLIFRTLGKRGALVSLAPLDPRFWDEDEHDRSRRMKTRLRAALIAALGPSVGLRPCEEPGCFLDRGIDGIDALDAMETLGPAHGRHPGVGRRFAPARRALDLDALAAPPARSSRRHPRAYERRPARPLPLDVHWEGGPAAALETFNARASSDGRVTFERRYETPWASTVRPAVETVEVEREALVRVREGMERALHLAAFRGINLPRPEPSPAATGVSPTAAAPSPLDELRLAGGRLYDLLFPLALERGLVRRGVFLGLGVDELLLEEPLELMHDRDDFLCLRHLVGRFVNAGPGRRPPHRAPAAADERKRRAALRALVIGVPESAAAPGRPLPHAAAEARAAAAALSGHGARVTEMIGPGATADAVYEALRAGPHIVHYSGHAELAQPAGASRLLLADAALDGLSLGRAVAGRPPALTLLNACDAARRPSFADAGRVQGLIDPLLEGGSYVVAARWPVTDGAATAFAAAFYEELLVAGRPLGAAVLGGRAAARAAAPADDLTWAAYVLYGDPRLALRRQPS